MQLLAHFPFFADILHQDESAQQLERRFQRACEQAGVDPGTPDALPIGIDIIADLASGWPRGQPAHDIAAAHGEGMRTD